MRSATRSRRGTVTAIAIVAIIAIVAVVVFRPAFSVEFLGDDYGLSLALDRGEPSWSRVVREFGQGWGGMGESRYYRPLVASTVSIDALFFDFRPFGLHLQNFLLHVCNAILVGVVLRRSSGSRCVWSSLGASLLFLVHPVAIAIPAGMVHRADALSTLFALMSILASVWYSRGHRAGLGLGLCAGSLALGLLAKEAAIVALPAMLVVHRRWRVAAVGAAVLLAWFVARHFALGAGGSASISSRLATLGSLAAWTNVGHGLKWLIAPSAAALGFAAVLLVVRKPHPGSIRVAAIATVIVLGPLLLAADFLVGTGDLPFGHNRLLYLPLAGVAWLLFAPAASPTPPWVNPVRVVATIGLLASLCAAAPRAIDRYAEAGAVTERTARAAREIARAAPERWSIVVTPPSEVGLPDLGAWFPLAMRPPFSRHPFPRVALSTCLARRACPGIEPVLSESGLAIYFVDRDGRVSTVRAASPLRGDLAIDTEPRRVVGRPLAIRLPANESGGTATLFFVTQAMPFRAGVALDADGRGVVQPPELRLLDRLFDSVGPYEVLLIAEVRDDAGRVRRSAPVAIAVEAQ